MIEVDAYARDCRLFGRVDLGTGRLTDLLNLAPELRIVDARLESLVDGHGVDLPELIVDREELCAVRATEPRGDVARRLRTHATRVVVELGPYHVEGSVHGTPASDPLARALRREAWVPLTDASIGYLRAGERVFEEMPTLLVNRDLATTFRHLEDVASASLPWEAASAARPPAARAARAIDLTSEIRDEDRRDPDDTPPHAPEPTI